MYMTLRFYFKNKSTLKNFLFLIKKHKKSIYT